MQVSRDLVRAGTAGRPAAQGGSREPAPAIAVAVARRQDDPMPLCFAFGSNLDVAAMEMRCPGACPLGPARLARHRLSIMREGFLTIVPDPRRTLHGLLWDVPLSAMAALDRYEEVGAGLYVKRMLPILGPSGPRRALVYVGTNAGPGLPRPGYLEGVLAAAHVIGMPADGLAELRRLAGIAPAAPPAGPRALGRLARP